MKRTLPIQSSFFCSATLIFFKERLQFRSCFKSKFILILIISLFYTSAKAQTITHPFTTGGTLNLPAGMDQVTLEGWGAGGAGGAATATALVVGRSAGGGGGGAYAKGTINTSLVQSLTLVVGGVNAGGTGNGAAGGASYATGFQTDFNAGGGQGGTANLSGSTTVNGGLGGIAIGNMTATNGQPGTGGTFSPLGALLVSGAGGNAANLGTGAGGTGGLSHTSIVIGTSAGNNGMPYGGGGGGAISALGVQNGGSGAQGYLIATYTCKTYSLSTTNASNVCTANGTSSVVTITGTAASLPRGNYTVTYNRSSPSATGQTADFTVTTAGTGSFTATGFATVGNSTITITSLRSVDCTSAISANNQVTIAITDRPTITLGAITSICSSASIQNVNLSYSVTTNAPTKYSITWNASPTNSFIPVTNATLPATPIVISVPAGTAVGNYTGTLTVTNAGCISINYPFTVPVIASPVAPTASATLQPSCANNTGTITVSSPASGSGFSYTIDGTNFNTTGVFTGLATGSYNVRVRNNTTLCQSPSTAVIINPVPVKTWNGSVSASWATAANWTPTGAPLASDCVVIPPMTISPIISGTNGLFFANRITIQDNGSLIVQGSNTLTVTNEVNVLGTGSVIFENNSSLVQISEAVNTGNITYKRDSKPIRRYDLTYWSSPVTRVPAFTLHDFSPNTLLDKYYKFDPNAGWIVILNGTEEMVKANGYSIRAPQPYDINTTAIYGGAFIGVPNNGTILGPAAVTDKSSLLGNPYPSAIYADKFIVHNTANYYGTLYFWTHNSSPVYNPADGRSYYNNNDFAIYNLSGNTTVGSMTGTGATTPGNTQAPAGYIAAGQGFFAISKTGQKAVFTNAMRESSNNSQFYKSSQDELERHRVWLNLTNVKAAFKQLLVGFIEGATDLWDDNYDAETLDANPLLDFYSINELNKLTIQGRALPFEESDTVSLGYKSSEGGEFTIAIERTDGNLSTQAIYLEDKTTNTLHNLRVSGYTFTTAVGVFNERFVLRFNDKKLGNDDFVSLDKNVFVSVKDKNIKLQAVSDTESLKETSIYDIGGKLLYRKENINNKELLITNLPPAHQVLLVKVTLNNGYTATKKIVF